MSTTNITATGAVSAATLSSSGNATIGGTLGVTGAATFSSTLNATGNITSTSNLYVNGGQLYLNSKLAANGKDTNNANTLVINGSGNFLEGTYVKNLLKSDTLDATTLSATTLSASSASFSGDVTVNGVLNSNEMQTNIVKAVGGQLYVSPTLVATTGEVSGTTRATIICTDSTEDYVWFTITDTSAIDSLTYGGANWYSGSKIMFTGTVRANLSGQPDIVFASSPGELTANMNGSSHTLQIKVKYAGASTYFSSAGTNLTWSDMSVMMYQINNSGTLYPIGVYIKAYGNDNKNSYIDIYGGTSATTSARLGLLDGVPAMANGTTPTGWGIYTNHGYFDGTIVSNSGVIGGWEINQSNLHKGNIAADDSIWLLTEDLSNATAKSVGGSDDLTTWRLTAGRNFGITKNGELYASEANVTGTINATELQSEYGTIGGWNLLNQGFYSTSVSNGITTDVVFRNGLINSISVNDITTSNCTLSVVERGSLIITPTSTGTTSITFDTGIKEPGTYKIIISASLYYYNGCDGSYTITYTNGSGGGGEFHYNYPIGGTNVTVKDFIIYQNTISSEVRSFVYTITFTATSSDLTNGITFDLKEYKDDELFNVISTDSVYINNLPEDTVLAVKRTENNTTTTPFLLQSDGTLTLTEANISGEIHASSGSTFGDTTKSYLSIGDSALDMYYNTNSIMHLGYGQGTGENGQTIYAPFFTMGDRASSAPIGRYSFTAGTLLAATGFSSTSFGCRSGSSGTASFSCGFGTNALSNYAFAEGLSTIARREASHAEGSLTTAGADSAYVKYGYINMSYISRSYGSYVESLSGFNHAEGYNTQAYGEAAHSEGISSKAYGDYSHAEGNSNAYADYSHADGQSTAYGRYSHASGLKTVATAQAQTVIGRYNTYTVIDEDGEGATIDPPIFDAGDYAFIIGNGFGDSANSRSNALTVDWSGNLITAGTITSGGGEVLAKQAMIDAIYPVGAIYMSVNSTSPATLFGGTWQQIQNQFLLAAGSSYAAGSTGGAATVTLTTDQIPAHTHGSETLSGKMSVRRFGTSDSGADIVITGPSGINGIISRAATTWSGTHGVVNIGSRNQSNPTVDVITVNATHEHNSVGGGKAHNNMPPYLAVYVWKRTA